MMTKDEQNIVREVYLKFLDSEGSDPEWTQFDESMVTLDWLEDKQIAIEASVKMQEQSKGTPRCSQDHPIENCFVPKIIESVSSIVNLYSDTGNLHENNRFILKYYLSLSQIGFIIY